MMGRKERLEQAEVYLEALLEKYQSVKIREYILFLKQKMGISEDLAVDYWSVIKTKPQFNNNGFEIRGKT